MIQSKVAMGGIGGSVAIILVWMLDYFFGVKMPEPVVQAVTSLCGFVAGYFTKSISDPINLTEPVK